MTLYFTSDSHFSHAKINEYANRPFGSVAEADEAMISKLLLVLGPEDTLFHLGDAALGPIEESLRLLRRVPGRKVLVPGNHDKVFSGNKPEYVAKHLSLYREVFDEIAPELTTVDLTDGRTVRLCHFPPKGDSRGKDRHVDRRPPVEGPPLLHGHTHSKYAISGARSFHVGVDAHNFAPVSETVVSAWLDRIGEPRP